MAGGKHALRLLLFLLLLVVIGPPVANAFELQIHGLKADLRKNVTDHLSFVIRSEETVIDRHLKAQIEQGVRSALRAKGYYNPLIALHFSNHNISRNAVLILAISSGEPLRIAGINVTINGPAKQDPDYQKLLKEALPVVDEVLDHGKFDGFLAQLSTLAAKNGYFDAAITSSELRVSPEQYQAFWHITFESGKRYCFGPTTIQGSPISPAIVQNLIPFRVGDPYTIKAVMNLNRCLSATQWFKMVTVVPNFKAVNSSHCLPLLVEVVPYKRNIIEVGLSYSTSIGPGIRTSWKKPWVNTLGHRLDSHLDLSKLVQQLSLEYKIPLQKSPLEQFYSVKAGYQQACQNDTISKEVTTDLVRYWDLFSGWRPAIELHWRYDHFTQGSQTQTTQLLYPGISFSRIRQRGGLMPEWGDSQRYSIDGSHRCWGSAASFGLYKMRHVWIRTPWQRHRCLMRVDVGWINTNTFSEIPPSLRLFAGGEDSIRGYDHRVLAPKDRQGKLVGASRLATGTLEYNYNLSQAWWLALFVDSGMAVEKFVRSDLRTGTGIGLRWVSPLGPIKLDIALPIRDPERRKPNFYFYFGTEL